MITPTVGRVVYFYVKESKYDFGHCFIAGKPHTALIVYVHSDKLINVTAFDTNGKQYPFTSVELVQDGGQSSGEFWCEWMPFQKGQAQKTEALEKELTAKG